MKHEEIIKIIECAKAEVEWNYPLDYAIAFDMAIEALEEQKNIVHCRDCKWFEVFKCGEMICAKRGAYGYEPNDFCSWGDFKNRE